ncbi:MAG: penicillin acylase family protein [Pyrinomonadaceae bacterium]
MKLVHLRILPLLLLLFSSAFAQTAATKLAVNGIKSEVTVRRDERSIPYIEAKTDDDLYFVQGYVTASDRLWQMELLRRVARGETAEIFGNVALEEDKRYRRFGFATIAEKSLSELSPQLRSALDNYARGVNAYIATLDDNTLPIEFKILQFKPRQWTAADSVVIGKILADALSTTWRNDLMRASLESLPKEKFADLTNQVTPYDVILFGKDKSEPAASVAGQKAKLFSTNWPPAYAGGSDITAAVEKQEQLRADSLTKVGLYAEELAASNNWVISGKHTADGKTLLANDPHLAPSAPGIWYLAHLSTPTMRVSGVTIPGAPGVILGHNEQIAWGATNVGPDVQDLYIETTEPRVARKEKINVRTNLMKPETAPVDFEVQETRNGPIIFSESGKAYSLKWTALDPKNLEFDAFFNLNRARNWDDFKNALKTYGGATQNFVYADTKGNIGWYAAGRIPIRRKGDGSLPYDGTTIDGDWVGFIPFDELPHLYNPPSGMIITANQRIVGTDYKYSQMSRDAAPPWRARRIYDELNGRKKITMDDVRDVMYDAKNIPLVNLATQIVRLNAASPETLVVLREWDGKMTSNSRGALLANEIRMCLANKIAEDNKPAPAFLIRERVLDWAVRDQSARWLPSGFAHYTELIKSCDTSSRASLADPKRFGPDASNWTWEKVFQSRFPHPLAAAPLIGAQFIVPAVPISGSGQTPNVGSAVSMRHIASPGNWDATRHVIPLGQSGDPKSEHFKDQFNAWRTGAPAVFPFTKSAVATATKSVTVLTPR